MKKNKVEIPEVDSSKLPFLSEKEMKELLLKLKHGNYECTETFIKGNTRLVLSIIQRFNNSGEAVDKLFGIGCIGLMKAIDNFDLNLNIKFSTHAAPMIIGEIRRYLRDNKSIRVSISLMNIANRAVEIRGRLVEQDNKEPALSKIAKELQLPIEEVIFALDALQDPVSMFEPVGDDCGESVYGINQVSNNKNSHYSRNPNISMKEAMNNLNLREKLILNLRFFDRRTQMEVAQEIGISKSQVSRIEKTALMNMRKYI